jgi:hypothetical protein
VIGTPGTLPNSQSTALAAFTGVNQRLDEMAAPRKDRGRTMIFNPAMNAAAVQGLAGLFNAQSVLDKQYRDGVMVDSLGLAYDMDQNVDVHTNGTANVTTNTVNGAGQTGGAITVAALNGTVTRGSKVSFAGVFAVNPQSRVSTGTLAQFTVTADAANGATSLSISPAIVATGAYQNVTASPANGAAITIFGTANGSYNANVAFHRDAFTLAMVPMWAPPGGKGVIDVAQETWNGLTMKVTEFYDGINDNSIIRFDVLFGYAAPVVPRAPPRAWVRISPNHPFKESTMKRILAALSIACAAIAVRLHDLLFAFMARAGLVHGFVLLNRGYKGYLANTVVKLATQEEAAIIAQGLGSNSAGPVTPGPVTTTAQMGRVGVAAGQGSIVITNPNIDAQSVVWAVVAQAAADTTALRVERILPAAGSVTIYLTANATAITYVDWCLLSISGATTPN